MGSTDPTPDGYYVINSRDITDQKRRERRLARQNDRLAEFAAMLSHDLRNPLTVADGYLELARDERDSDHLRAIGDAHERMATLIEDMLLLAREGEEIATVEEVTLADTVRKAWHSVDSRAATLDVRTDSTLVADESRLAQLLENLTQNAIEHGGADVTVTVGELEDGFYVEDDGPGIPESERDSIFESGYSTTEGGTGLGLRIVKTIVDAHDWQIRVTDGADSGVRFEICGTRRAA